MPSRSLYRMTRQIKQREKREVHQTSNVPGQKKQWNEAEHHNGKRASQPVAPLPIKPTTTAKKIAQ